MESTELSSLPRTLYNDKSFLAKVRQVLSLSTVKKKYIDMIMNEKGCQLFEQAFTHSSYDPGCNYEWLEILGDATLNKCIVWYINKRFPQLHNAEGVKVIARLKINLVSKKHFSDIAERLGFLSFIRFNENNLKTATLNVRSILEDVFEAFFGVVEMLLDQAISPGAGYGICFHLLQNIMDPLPISLRYEDLYDPITRLKETFDIYRSSLWGQVRYENYRQDMVQHVQVYQYDSISHRKVLIASATGANLDEAKQAGANLAIEILAKRGFRRPVPEYYIALSHDVQMAALRNSNDSQLVK